MHRRKGAIEQKQQEPEQQQEEKEPEVDINKIIMDLYTISKVSSNLALSLSVYANQKGELDTGRFRLVKTDDDQAQEQNHLPVNPGNPASSQKPKGG